MTDNNAYFKPHELRYAVGRPAPMANKKKKTTKKKTTEPPALPGITITAVKYDFDFPCAFGNISSASDVDSLTVTIEQHSIANTMVSAFTKMWKYFAYRTVEIELVPGHLAHDDVAGQELINEEELLQIVAETHSVRTSGRKKLGITLSMKELSDPKVLTLRHLKNTTGRIRGRSLDQIPEKTRGRKKKVVAPETDPDQGTFGDQENDDD